MSAAAAEAVEDAVEASPSSKKGKKKLIVIIALAVLLAGGAGGGAFVWKKKKAAAAAAAAAAEAGADGEATPIAHAEDKHKDEHKGPPTFLPLDPFVINLADRESERFAQVGLTLELSDPKVADQIKAYMPAIHNGVLMVLASKTSQELLSRKGKEKLADEIMREAVRPLGIELAGEEDEAKGEKSEGGKTPIEDSPVRKVHFSSFIIQ
jgi:flagellar FliL protein